MLFTKSDIESYFTAFKHENLFLVIIALLGIAVAMIFFFYFKTAWHRGFAIPLIVFGVMHCMAGYNNYKKADHLRVRNTYGYDMKPAGLKTQELQRVKEAGRNIDIFLYINIALLAGAVFLFMYVRNKEGAEDYKGIAAGLIIMTVITIGSSLFMRTKTQAYIKGIENFQLK